MNAMLAAFAAAIFIAISAYYGLHETGFSTAEQGTGSAVRLGN